MASWEGWSVGSFAFAWLPETALSYDRHERTWRLWPILVLGVFRGEQGSPQFTVARLQDRRAANRKAKTLRQPARWAALASLLLWPRDSEFVPLDQVETIDECGLRTWRRKHSPSLAKHWVISSQTGRLKTVCKGARDGVDAALQVNVTFKSWSRLPRELRDKIYSYALFDEHQMTEQSRIYVHAKLSTKTHVIKWPALPSFQTPGIMRVSRRGRREALEVMYRTKLLVITVDSASASSACTEQWPPWMWSFTRVRFEIALHQNTPEEICRSFQQIAIVLSHFVRALKSLEIRVRYPRNRASALSVDHRGALVLTANDVARGMLKLRKITRVRDGESASHWSQIEWGVIKKHKDLGDYLCNYMYLAAEFLNTVWNNVTNEPGERDCQVVDVQVEECRDFGCCLHCR